MVILLFSVLIVFLILWLLIAPIQVLIDTNTKSYCISWRGIISVYLVVISGEIALRFTNVFWKKEIFPFRKNAKRKIGKPKSRKSSDIKFSYKTTRRIIRLLKSFKMKNFKLNVDTDDVILNSYLYPTFVFISHMGIPCRINYNGELEFKLLAENRLYRIIKAWKN